jgi:hypothetical protein
MFMKGRTAGMGRLGTSTEAKDKEAETGQSRRKYPIRRLEYLPDPDRLEDATDPHRLARMFLDQLGWVDGLPVLRLWQEKWWHWVGSHYSEVLVPAIRD